MRKSSVPVLATIALVVGAVAPALGQLVDRTLAPNAANEGIAKSLLEQIGAGRGDAVTCRSTSPSAPGSPTAARLATGVPAARPDL